MTNSLSTLLSPFALFAALAAVPVRAAEPAPFTVTVEAPAGKAGATGTARVAITPGAGYHMNKEFPTSLKLVAPAGVDLARMTVRGNDPGSQISEGGVKLDVQYTPKEAGKKVITGTLKFAVCTATSCDPRTAPVSITVDVK